MDEVQGFLHTAERELRRVSVISNQTLRFHKQSTQPTLQAMDALVDEVLAIHHGRLLNSHIEIAKRCHPDLYVMCFEGEIRQVLNNLIGNAVDAMHPLGGRLLLRCRAATNWSNHMKGLTVTVADTGTGIPHFEQNKIFDAFYTTKGIGGTGLGLWVSKEIVARHHGKLRMRSSQHEGRSGTVFTLFLPFDAVDR
jgi:signal transduction histidine kinase